MAFAEPGNCMRIEPQGLGHIVDDQVAFGGLLLGSGLAVAAAHEQDHLGKQGGCPSERGSKWAKHALHPGSAGGQGVWMGSLLPLAGFLEI